MNIIYNEQFDYDVIIEDYDFCDYEPRKMEIMAEKLLEPWIEYKDPRDWVYMQTEQEDYEYSEFLYRYSWYYNICNCEYCICF